MTTEVPEPRRNITISLFKRLLHKNGTVTSMRKSLPLAIPVLHPAKFCSPSNPGLFPSSISEIALYSRFCTPETILLGLHFSAKMMLLEKSR